MKPGRNLIRSLLLMLVAIPILTAAATAGPMANTGKYSDNVTNEAVLRVENSNNSSNGGYAFVGINRSKNVWRPAIYGENKGSSAGIYGRSDGWHAAAGWYEGNGGNAGVFGHNGGTGPGVYGESTKEVSGNHGVYGTTQGNWGWASGVFGKSFKSNAIGVTGWNNGSGTGVYGYSDRGTALVAKSASGNIIEAYDASPDNRRFYVANDGMVYADGSFRSGGADMAEMLPAVRGLEPGDVLIMGASGQLTHTTSPYDPAVVGVYSTEPGFVGGANSDHDSSDKIPLAIVGIVPCKVSAENGPIRVGDLLSTSSTAGYAMRASNAAAGTVFAKALGELHEDSGVISVLVMLQ